ncbi:hypothetical protein OIB37_31690 [Streptomyces sp. NBC_00820]|uniref:hypothetical protein n=1 Tax=Streptomyces sp. NBC_00820 TaxID=2975842 RepID=UPI002ED27605|nr:hypothetical protein OIB37_31690 [Streptomyces sp. NBC_00820]
MYLAVDHAAPRAMSRTPLRSVSCPRPWTIARAAEGSTRASAVAWKRVPSRAPAAPQCQDGGQAAAVGDPAGRQYRNRCH